MLDRHGNDTGSYITHVYVDGTMSGSSITEASPAVINVQAPTEVPLSQGSYDIYVSGVGEQVSGVSFPTWTENGGQDALETPWIQGTKLSNGTWELTVHFSKHNNETGIYQTDIYTYDQYGNNKLIVWNKKVTVK